MKYVVNLLIIINILSGCASVNPPDYAQEKPALDLAQYFNGTIDAWGMFQDRSGKVVKRFTVVIAAKWDGNVGTLDEDFTYADGSKDRRVWTITKLDANHYSGTAGDVNGSARGEAYGNALNWRYVLKLKVGDNIYNVNFNDWMYLMDDKVMLNRAEMSKFGFKLGEVTLSFRKR
jgi:Protein of unknown function (DUF3833)